MFYFNANILQSIFCALCVKNKHILRGSHAVCLLFCSIHEATIFCAVIYCLLIRVEGCHTAYYTLQKHRCINPFHSPSPPAFVSVLNLVQKRLFASSCLSVRPSVHLSACINSAPTGTDFSQILYLSVSLKHCR